MLTKPVFTYVVTPSLPEKLKELLKIAYNLWWCWHHDAINLFFRLDPDLWEDTNHNPVQMLGLMRQDRLNELAEDGAFMAHLRRVSEQCDNYMSETTWYKKTYGKDNACIAYFSAEFGITESLPFYSGGLGVLSGDHLKSSSDLGIPLTGIGILYQEGYFRQYLSANGWQQEQYPKNDFYNLPVVLQKDGEGKPVTISVDLPGRKLHAQIWKMQVGRVPVYLLDTNVPMNFEDDRGVSGRLYGGDSDMRIRQEILLGIGGIRALHALGIHPSVCHMNEGHSAFLALERIRRLMEENNLSFDEAREAVTGSNVFTTHTPVPAGNDVFPAGLMEKYFGSFCRKLDIPASKFLSLGRMNPNDEREGFCLTVLALRLARHCNGVSGLHGEVSRNMWKGIWPNVPMKELPIKSITNGIHSKSWISIDMAQLFDRYLGPRWEHSPEDHDVWEKIDKIPGGELWRTHERRRERLVAFARRRLQQQLKHRGVSLAEIQLADEVLNPEALTIGFARRFATYKRANLIFRDIKRLTRILTDHERPVQFIFAGKAHPRDNEGKEIIRNIVETARSEEFRQSIVFIEDYDINVARYMVSGVDVWLNNPRRPLEASGTSGMKASVNGVINLSVLDGWWVEAYENNVGWSIGNGEEYEDHELHDELESKTLYDLLEHEIIPLFYKRGHDGLPREWINMMKYSMRKICPVFNTNRMVQEYNDRFYQKSHEQWHKMLANNLSKAKDLAQWKTYMTDRWRTIRIEDTSTYATESVKVGSELEIYAHVYLGHIGPEEVAVEIFQGVLDSRGMIDTGNVFNMTCCDAKGNGTYTFVGTIPCSTSGLHGYTIRILPRHDDLFDPFEANLIMWGG